MKKIIVQKYDIKNPNGEFITTKDLIINCLNYIPKEGISMDEIVQRTNIESSMETEEITLSDLDISYLKYLVRSCKWGFFNKEIADFGLYIQNL